MSPYANIVFGIYEGDIFSRDTTGRDGKPRKDGKHLLYTEIKEKAMRHGFQRGKYYFYKLVEPDEYEVYVTKKKYWAGDYYFVKYKDDFFSVEDDFFSYAARLARDSNGDYPEERGDMVFIYTGSHYLLKKYGLPIIGDSRDGRYGKWVKEAETIPIDKITDRRLACYCPFGLVMDILDQKEDMYLVASNLEDGGPWYVDDRFVQFGDKPKESGWEKVGDHWQKWMPGEKLYIYGEEEIPPRI